MKTAYRTRLAPYQIARRTPLDTSDSRHPIRKELDRLSGATLDLQVSFEEDTEAAGLLSHIPRIVPLRCVMRHNGEIVGLGRSVAVMSRLNRSIERSLNAAISGSFLSAAGSACKVLEAQRLEESRDIEEAYRSFDSEPASDKQRNYLQQLIQVNVADESERENLLQQLPELSKREASTLIASYAK